VELAGSAGKGVVTFLLLTLCALFEVFLLWFLVALFKERPNAFRRRVTDVGPKETQPISEGPDINSQTRNGKNSAWKTPKSAALLLIGSLLLALPLRAQETTSPNSKIRPAILT
jgi:hypothetical protein